MSSEKIIVLYERLSREDENLGESYSISNQKKLLEDYCGEKGWTRFRHFTDDGISGTTFDRPSFKAMIQLVEDGEVETIILKDMSRLGRDYLVVGQLREFFRKKGVRLIAINDNHDSCHRSGWRDKCLIGCRLVVYPVANPVVGSMFYKTLYLLCF